MNNPPLLQSTAGLAAGTNPYSLSFPKPVSFASALVGFFSWGAGNVTIQQLGDNLNGANAWTRVGFSTVATRTVGVIFFSNTRAGILTLSMQLSSTIAQVSFSLFEFGYCSVATDLVLPGGNATATTTPSVGPITPTLTSDLVLAAVKGTGIATQNTPGWSAQNITQFSSEFIFPGSIAPISASWVMPNSAPYTAIIAALKISPYAAQPPPGGGISAGSNPLALTSANGQQGNLSGANPGAIVLAGAPSGALVVPGKPFAI